MCKMQEITILLALVMVKLSKKNAPCFGKEAGGEQEELTTDLGNMTYEERLRELDLFSPARDGEHKSFDRQEIVVRR